jgi:hypothetical protein
MLRTRRLHTGDALTTLGLQTSLLDYAPWLGDTVGLASMII